MAKHWFVTGSASGLGRSIAEAVLASGDSLVATAREHAVSRRQVGCWRIYRVACQGSGTFWCEGVCPRTWRNANQLGEPGESKYPGVASGLRTVRRRGGFRTEIVLGTRGERPRES